MNNTNSLMVKEFEKEIESRPFRIYWHNKFLRSYETEKEMNDGLNFFNKFLISITFRNIKKDK